MKQKQNIFKIVNTLVKNSKKETDEYNTGLIGEKLIISSYKNMELEKLEKMRYIINKIIKKKKEMKRVNEHKNRNNVNSDNTN